MGGSKSKAATESARSVLARRGNLVEHSASNAKAVAADATPSTVKSRFPSEQPNAGHETINGNISMPSVRIGKFSVEEMTNKTIADKFAQMPTIKTTSGSQTLDTKRERTAGELRIKEQLNLDAADAAQGQETQGAVPRGRLSEDQLMELFSKMRAEEASKEYSLSVDLIIQMKLAAKVPEIAVISEEGVDVKLAK